jgi:hypothetical protein
MQPRRRAPQLGCAVQARGSIGDGSPAEMLSWQPARTARYVPFGGLAQEQGMTLDAIVANRNQFSSAGRSTGGRGTGAGGEAGSGKRGTGGSSGRSRGRGGVQDGGGGGGRSKEDSVVMKR